MTVLSAADVLKLILLTFLSFHCYSRQIYIISDSRNLRPLSAPRKGCCWMTTVMVPATGTTFLIKTFLLLPKEFFFSAGSLILKLICSFGNVLGIPFSAAGNFQVMQFNEEKEVPSRGQLTVKQREKSGSVSFLGGPGGHCSTVCAFTRGVLSFVPGGESLIISLFRDGCSAESNRFPASFRDFGMTYADEMNLIVLISRKIK